jgi:hypothetical protein
LWKAGNSLRFDDGDLLKEHRKAIEAYQGYSTKTVAVLGDLEKYCAERSEYAYIFHFDSKPDWGKAAVDFEGKDRGADQEDRQLHCH